MDPLTGSPTAYRKTCDHGPGTRFCVCGREAQVGWHSGGIVITKQESLGFQAVLRFLQLHVSKGTGRQRFRNHVIFPNRWHQRISDSTFGIYAWRVGGRKIKTSTSAPEM